MIITNRTDRLVGQLNDLGFNGEHHRSQVDFHLARGIKLFELMESLAKKEGMMNCQVFINKSQKRKYPVVESYLAKFAKITSPVGGIINGIDCGALETLIRLGGWQPGLLAELNLHFTGKRCSDSLPGRVVSGLFALPKGPDPCGRQVADQLIYQYFLDSPLAWFINVHKVRNQFETQRFFSHGDNMVHTEEAFRLLLAEAVSPPKLKTGTTVRKLPDTKNQSLLRHK